MCSSVKFKDFLIIFFDCIIIIHIECFFTGIKYPHPLIKGCSVAFHDRRMLIFYITFLFTAITIAPFISSFITQYISAHYHSCGDNTGIFSGEAYVKNGMDCNLLVW
ncbi:TPA: hypothetical protein HNC63_17895 [Escherichia fergusonii]|nr:hypothetical protein C5U37_17270 [Escherichia fergusonii]HAJ6531562.1 hypothetical protein [Escherichia fergusonii]HAJ6561568.1 hypothetical protein [Escherichia fergusonii]HAJ6571095.1 hypothetical protein [Escherichia fergusonii]